MRLPDKGECGVVPTLNFVPANTITFAKVTVAFNRAFAGYFLPMMQSPQSLATIIRETDVALDKSLTLMVGGAAMGIGLVAVRGPRAWIAGMGVDPHVRRQGAGRELLRRMVSELQNAGIREVSLETLIINIPAITLYTNAGFRDTRELRVFQGEVDSNAPPAGVAGGERPRAVSRSGALHLFDDFHQIPPAWQREARSIAQIRRQIRGMGLWRGDELRAYILFAWAPGGLIIYDGGSCDPSPSARVGHLVSLLRHIVGGREHTVVRAINVPVGDALGEALTTLGVPIAARQREMALDLSHAVAHDERGAL